METIILKLAIALLIISFLYGATLSDDYITGTRRITRQLNILDRFINGLIYFIFAFGYLTILVCIIFGIIFIIKG